MSLSSTELAQRLLDAGNNIRRVISSSSSNEELLRHLQTIESLLGQVEQEPPKAVEDAILPSVTALISDQLFRHSDMDVKVSVLACITELVRISAPQAPYTDEQMKDVFQLTIAAFDHLSPTEGHCYNKAKSVLDVVSRIRSCVILLDLECHEFIVDMFQHFFKHIGPNHPEDVFQSMERIMTLVVDESDGLLPLGALTVLLANARKENQDISPVAFSLAENVITKCAVALEPHVVEAVKTMDIDLDDDNDIMLSIYQNGIKNLKNKFAGDNPKGRMEPKGLARDAAGPSKIVGFADGASKSTSNGTTCTENYDKCANNSLPAEAPDLLVIHPERANSKTDLKLKELLYIEKGKYKSKEESIHKKRGPILVSLDDEEEDKYESEPHCILQKKGVEKEGHCEEAPSILVNLDNSKIEVDPVPEKKEVKLKAVENQEDGYPKRANSRGAAGTNISLSFKVEKVTTDQESVPKKREPKRSTLKSPKGQFKRINSREVSPKTRGPKPNFVISKMKGQPKQVYSRCSYAPKHASSNEANTSEVEPTTIPQKRGRKTNSLMNHSWITLGKRTPIPSRQRKCRDSLLSENSASKKSPSSLSTSENVIELTDDLKPKLDGASQDTPKPTDKTNRIMGGRLKRKGSMLSQEVDAKSPFVLKNEQSSAQVEEMTPKPTDATNRIMGDRVKTKGSVLSQEVDVKSHSVLKEEQSSSQVEKMTPKPTDTTNRIMGGRLKRKGSMLSQEVDAESPSVLKEEESSAQVEEKTPKQLVICLKKETEGAEISEEKEQMRLSRCGLAAKTKKETIVASGDGIAQREGKLKSTVKLEAENVENSSSLKGSKRRKRSNSNIKNIDSDSGIKSSNGDTSHKGKGTESIFKRSRVIGKEETSESPDLGKSLVGRGIMVWWPLDKAFYEGVVHSYDPLKKKHKISYIDGDEEILNLKRQRFYLIGPDPLASEGQKNEPAQVEVLSPVLSTPQEGKAKTKLVQGNQVKQEEADSSPESDLLKGLRKPRLAYGKSLQKSSQAKEAKADQVFGSSQEKGIQKAMSVRGKQVKRSNEGKQAKAGSSSKRAEIPADKAKSLDTVPLKNKHAATEEVMDDADGKISAGSLKDKLKTVSKGI